MLPDNINELEYLLTWIRGYNFESHFLFHDEILYELFIENNYYIFKKYIKDIEDILHFKEIDYYSYEMYKYETTEIENFLFKHNKISITKGNMGRDMILKKYATIVRKNKIKKLLK